MNTEYLDLGLEYSKSYVFLCCFYYLSSKHWYPYDYSTSSFGCLSISNLIIQAHIPDILLLNSPLTLLVHAKTPEAFLINFSLNPYIQQFVIIVGMPCNPSKYDYSLLSQQLPP